MGICENAQDHVIILLVLCRSRHDSQGRECIILNGTIRDVQDERKNFVFYLSCAGVQDMYFSVEEEEVYLEWLSKLRTACSSGIFCTYHFIYAWWCKAVKMQHYFMVWHFSY